MAASRSGTPDRLPLESGPRDALREYARRLAVLTMVALAITSAIAFIVVLAYFTASQPQYGLAVAVVVVAILMPLGYAGLLQVRRRVTYSVVYDGSVMDQAAESTARIAKLTIRSEDDNREIESPSLVMVRLRNDGLADLDERDWINPITFEFPGRRVVGLDAIEPPLMREDDIHVREDRLALPPYRLHRGARVRLLVLLSGPGKGVIASGTIRGARHGGIHTDGPRRSRYRAVYAAALLLTLTLGLVVGLLVAPGVSPPAPGCANGHSTVYASNDFAPVITELAAQYERGCPGAHVTVVSAGSNSALSSFEHGQSASTTLVAATGPADQVYYPSLVRQPLAIVLYSLVINKAAAVHSLTSAEIRGIYAGTYTNWRPLGGADLPITIVGRDATSPSRLAFEQRVLGAAESPQGPPCGGSPGRCTAYSTLALLDIVNTTPGGIGYAPTTAAVSASHSEFQNINQLFINGSAADPAQVLAGNYDYWAIAYLYSFGVPASGSLSSSFINHLGTAAAQKVLLTPGTIPCGTDPLCG
jgi:phosphate transport system substrate-binding protein